MMKYEETETPGYVQIIGQDGTQIEFEPQDALALLQWRDVRRDRFQEAIRGDQPTTKRSLVRKREDLPEWIQEEP
jgi:hypothetical protein